MGISLPPLPNVNPGVTGSSIPSSAPLEDMGAAFLQAFLAAQQQRGADSRSSSELEQRKQEFELHKRKLDMELNAQRIALEQARAQGTAAKVLLPHLVQMGGANQLLQLPQMQGTPPMAPGAPQLPVLPQQVSGPMDALAKVSQGLPAEAVPEFTKQFSGLAERAQGKADRLAGIERAVGAITDESKRPGARALLTFAELGANLPKEVQAQLFPQLFPQDGSVDPQSLNAATTMFRTGAFSWGQARRQAGLKQVPGIPDDVKFQPFPTRPRQDQLKAGAQLDVMVASKSVLDEYSTRKPPGILVSWIKGGKAGGWRELLGNPALSAQDRQFLQSARQFTDAWVRVVSGAQTNEQEYGRFIAAITEAAGDDEQTRAQKRNMRAIMTQAVADIAGGAVTPTQAIDRALKMDWTPEQKRFLTEERTKAVKYEADLKAGRVKIDTSAPSPDSPDDFEDQMARIISAIDQLRNP